MTEFNSLCNLNMSYIDSGMSNWFTPGFSSFNTPTFTFPNIFSMENNIFTNMQWNTNFNFNFDFSNLFSNNFSNSNFAYNSPNALTFKSSNIGDSFSFTNKNKKTFSLSDYNANAGEKLAQTALKNTKGWTGYCAKHVKTAIQSSGLGEYESGHAYQMTSILRNNENFKEISPSEYNVKDLPAGCVLVYNKGSQGYSNKYGHTEITTGDGRAVSDGITHNLRKPDAIFMPVSA